MKLAVDKIDLLELGYPKEAVPRILRKLRYKVTKGKLENHYTILMAYANDGDL